MSSRNTDEKSNKLVPLNNWRALDSILASRFISTLFIWLIVVPIAAKAMSEFPDQIDISNYFRLPDELLLNLELPFSWAAFYFAAVLGYISRILYVIFCPDLIKEHASPNDAISKGMTLQRLRRHIADYLEDIKEFSDAEKECLVEMLKQWRVGSNGSHDLETATHDITRPDLISGKEFAGALLSASISESREKPGYYELGAIPNQKAITVEKNQFFRTAFLDFERLLQFSHPSVRNIITVMLFFAAFSALMVFLQSLASVLKVLLL